jgi:hypothetical protein
MLSFTEFVCLWVFLSMMKLFYRLHNSTIAGLTWIVIVSSCANQGMPTGGPQDTIPPVLVGTDPQYKALNYNGDEVRMTFNEFIIPDQVSEMLVVSPPLEKRPTILTRSKSLIVRFNEELRDSVTYSLDFKNSVVDNNERNPYLNLRFLFSTGDKIDTFRIAGRVLNAFNLEPMENALVLLHKNLHDSAVFTLRPDYIAKSNKEGLFLFDNIAKGSYHIFSLSDMNNDMLYNEGAEKIAFSDSLLVPSAEYHAEPDTLARGADSLLVAGHIHFSPGPVYLRQFTEKIFEQYLKNFRRDSRYMCTFVFNESVRDSFIIRLVDSEAADTADSESPIYLAADYNSAEWYLLEPNLRYDSLTMWITDSVLAEQEMIHMELSYLMLDSLNQLFLKKDTVEMQFREKEEETKRRRRERDDEEEEPPPVVQFNWLTSITSSGFGLNKDIILTSPQPVLSLDTSAIQLCLADDTLKTPLSYTFEKDTLAWRTYRITFPWESETGYTLEIDSAACVNIYGITSKKLQSSFKTQKRDYYGIINLEVTGVTGQVLLQLLENNEEETVITQKMIAEDQKVVFDYLEPAKYRIKVIYDENENGKWDEGSYQDRYQPERVAYINEVIKVRSNWDSNLSWNLEFDPTFTKNIRDRELEEQQRKEAEEKARQERDGQLRTPQQQNDMFRQSGSSSGSLQPFR